MWLYIAEGGGDVDLVRLLIILKKLKLFNFNFEILKYYMGIDLGTSWTDHWLCTNQLYQPVLCNKSQTHEGEPLLHNKNVIRGCFGDLYIIH